MVLQWQMMHWLMFSNNVDAKFCPLLGISNYSQNICYTVPKSTKQFTNPLRTQLVHPNQLRSFFYHSGGICCIPYRFGNPRNFRGSVFCVWMLNVSTIFTETWQWRKVKMNFYYFSNVVFELLLISTLCRILIIVFILMYSNIL